MDDNKKPPDNKREAFLFFIQNHFPNSCRIIIYPIQLMTITSRQYFIHLGFRYQIAKIKNETSIAKGKNTV